MWRPLPLLVVAVWTLACAGTPSPSPSRVAQIRQRGVLVCGVSPGIAGFSTVDEAGRYSGFDVDLCRAVAAAIVGRADAVRFAPIATLDELRRSNEIDIVSRRLTWSLQREGMRVLFGPVTFYDGQGFLVPRQLPAERAADLANVPICVAGGTEHDETLTGYFRRNHLALDRISVHDGAEAGRALVAGRCRAFSADVSELASVRSAMPHPGDYRILEARISREPLAQLVRQEDTDLFNVLRWTVFAMIASEELGVSSSNLGEMGESDDPDIRRLLGVTPGNGSALGLDESWARHVIAEVGNYGEVFERNLGRSTPIGMDRGLNALSAAGGLMFAPSLR